LSGHDICLEVSLSNCYVQELNKTEIDNYISDHSDHSGLPLCLKA